MPPQRSSYMVSFGASKHFPIKPTESLVKKTKPKPLHDPPNALYMFV